MTARTVLVLNHFARPRSIAGGTRHAELFSRLSGWQARIVAGDKGLKGSDWHGRDGIVETVRTVPFTGNGLTRILNWVSYAVAASLRGMRARPLDAVYASSPHLLAGLAGWFVARVRRVPFVLEIRDVWPQVLADMGSLSSASVLYRLLERLEIFLYVHAERVVFLAEGVENHLFARGVKRERLCFIPNGADCADFRPSCPRDVLRSTYDLSGVVAVYAGSHGPANGLDLLLDAAAIATKEVEGLFVVLVGDGVEKDRLKRRVADEGLTNVSFMDPIPKNEIPDLLAAADIGVHCLADVELFRTGVSPNKLFDYMAAGLPAITNTPGVTSEFLERSGGGIAVQPGDLDLALVQLAALSPGERRRLGDNGRRYLESTRSRSLMAARLESLLDDLVPPSVELSLAGRAP
jgi:glycosyltransferase involved in cell wall biosynthesis